MKRAIVLCVLCAAATAGFAAPTVTLTGGLTTSFDAVPSVQEALAAFQGNSLMWGLGWEIVPRRIGVGGTAMVSLFRDTLDRSVIDWFAVPVSMSYHVFGGGAFIDPYVEAGLGCTGRVLTMDAAGLYLSLFPYVAGGLSVRIGELVVGGKFGWAPVSSPVPATTIPAYPMGRFSVTLSAGISLG
jgi:hypothetical protein